VTGKIVIVTGASRGLGRLSANALAQGGDTVYAAMRETAGRNAGQADDARAYARQHGVDLRVIELDVCVEASVDEAVARVIAEHGRIDVVVHAAGRMAFGPAEAFTPEQLAELLDVNLVSPQRVNRAVLPQMRQQGQGLLVWLSCSSVAGGALPYLSLHVAAKAGLDALAVQYARELSRWGIETSLIVPGLLASEPRHPPRFELPHDAARAAAYDKGLYAGLAQVVEQALSGLAAGDADPGAVAGAIACVVDTPFGERPFRVHVDPREDGAAVTFPVIDRVRDDMLRCIGLADLLRPAHRLPHPQLSSLPAGDPG
jgi:NAD(P)-dependent dehydrogenase (short-subunit alcohol dehydrogenase family)